ncbi:MAG TPA: ORF6N domain-containing protein [Bacteroidota bacterium]|nr:ORF6N domain-containing protein [Bacteroidota bacterium]
MKRADTVVPREAIEGRIYLLREEKVMLSTDHARLCQVAPRALVQAVKRNILRFPSDFMFQLSGEEFENLKSQMGFQEPLQVGTWGGSVVFQPIFSTK